MLINSFFRPRPYTVTTYPTPEFENLRRQMNEFFDTSATHKKQATWPKATLFRDDEGLSLTVALPGLGAEDITIKTEDGELTLQGERPPAALEGYQPIRRERSPVKFLRRFRLPRRVDAAAITAKMENGLLTIRLPARPEHQPRKISIES